MALEEKVSRWSKTKKWMKRTAIVAAVLGVGPCAVNTASIPVAKGINTLVTDESSKAAVFVSGVDYKRTIPQLALDVVGGALGYPEKVTHKILPDYLTKNETLALSKTKISGITKFFMYTPITIRQTLEGNRAEWYRNATASQIDDIVSKPEYNTVIFVGHGSYTSAQAEDKAYNSAHVIELNIPPKEAVIQHTCTFGKGKRPGLKEAFRAERGYAVGNGEISEVQNYTEAWKRVFIGY